MHLGDSHCPGIGGVGSCAWIWKSLEASALRAGTFHTIHNVSPTRPPASLWSLGATSHSLLLSLLMARPNCHFSTKPLLATSMHSGLHFLNSGG